MKTRKMLLAASAISAILFSAPAFAAPLLDLVDAPGQSNTPYALTFTATGATTAISFAGYQVPSSETATSIGLFLNDAGTSLIGGQYADFTLTRAPSGSLVYDPGNGLGFAGVTAGSYDTFTQNVATVAGSNYTLRFNYSNSPAAPSGFRVSADAVTGAVPEPATWAMMIIGFGLMGASLRSRKAKVAFA